MSSSPYKRIAITGASGFLGQSLVQYLAQNDYQIIALSRHCTDYFNVFPENILAHNTDIRNKQALKQYLKDCDAVIHLAAIYHIGYPNHHEMADINIMGTQNVLEICQDLAIKKLVYISTTAVHGESGANAQDENHTHNGTFRSYYEETKYIAHQLVLKAINQGMPITIVSPGGIFGESDKGAIANLLKDYSKEKLPFMIQSTSQFTLTHVKDIVLGIELALSNGIFGREYILSQYPTTAWNLLNHAFSTFKKPLPKLIHPKRLKPIAIILDHISKLTGKTLPLNSEILRIMDGSHYIYHSQRARNELNWQPQPFEQRFQQYLHYLNEKNH